MKKILFTLLTFIAFCGGAWADTPEISIGEVLVTPGGQGMLCVNLNPNGEQCRDLQIDITIPEGFSIVGSYQNKYLPHGMGSNTADTPSGLSGTTMRFTMTNTNGELLHNDLVLKMYIKDNGGHEVGQTFSSAATTVILSCNNVTAEGQVSGVKDFKYSSIPYTVKIVEPGLYLYEDFVLGKNSSKEEESQITSDYEGPVQVFRSLKAGQWNTIVLPFPMDEQQIISCFGADVQIAELTSVNLENVTVAGKDVKSLRLGFSSVNPLAMDKHNPYIIKTQSIGDIDAKVGFKLDNANVTRCGQKSGQKWKYSDPSIAVGESEDYFSGIYDKRTLTSYYDEEEDFYIYYAYLSGNKFNYTDLGSSVVVKGFRGYFELEKLQEWIEAKNNGAESGVNINLFVDEDAITGIEGITASAPIAEGIYDLQGRKVSNDIKSLKKGVYIIDGKKTLIK